MVIKYLHLTNIRRFIVAVRLRLEILNILSCLLCSRGNNGFQRSMRYLKEKYFVQTKVRLSECHENVIDVTEFPPTHTDFIAIFYFPCLHLPEYLD